MAEKKYSWINYEVLKDKWFRSESKTFAQFLIDEKIKTYSKEKVSWWVKQKKSYIQDRLNEARKNVDKDVEDELEITANKLMKAKIDIIEELIDRVWDIKKLKKSKKNWFTTTELIQINTLIKTELWEASDIKKIEWGEWLFTISIIPK
jgi:SPX domain protein involved in polyphosphate accumulation